MEKVPVVQEKEGPFELADTVLLTSSLSYRGFPYDFAQSRFTSFEFNPVYQFPTYFPTEQPTSTQLLIPISKLVQSSAIDLESALNELEKESPFKNPEIINSLKESESHFEDSSFIPPVAEGTDLSREELLVSHSIEEELSNVDQAQTKVEEEIPKLSMEPAPEVSQERFSLIADEGSVFSEGPIQVLPHFLENGLSAKNPLVPQMRVELVRIPEKVLLSVNPSVTTDEVSELFYQDQCYSPITPKFAFCQTEESDLSLINAIPATGFMAIPTIQYSEDKASAQLDLSLSKLYIKLMAQPVLECIGTTEVLSISFGFEHAALLTGTGKIMTWGFGGSGCLGHKDTLSQPHPVLVGDLLKEFSVFVQCGGYHTVCVTENGELYSWGRGDVHQLGVAFKYLTKDEFGYTTAKPTKIAFFTQNLIKVHSIACGEAHTLVLDYDGKVYSFGWGEDGQLGISRHLLNKAMISTQINIVQALEDKQVTKVVCGSLFSACLTAEGSVFVWGSGEQGQLGLKKNCTQNDFPVQIEDLSPVLDILCGTSSMLCVDIEQNVWGWGIGKALDMSSSGFASGSEVVCYSPKYLEAVEAVVHLKIDKEKPPAQTVPSIDYQERVSELAEQLRTLYSLN